MTLWSVFSQHNSNVFLENNISERARNFTEDLNSLWPDSQRGKGHGSPSLKQGGCTT